MSTSAKKEEMEIDSASGSGSGSGGFSRAGPASCLPVGSAKPKPRFEIKKYNAVALWAWGTVCEPPVASAC